MICSFPWLRHGESEGIRKTVGRWSVLFHSWQQSNTDDNNRDLSHHHNNSCQPFLSFLRPLPNCLHPESSIQYPVCQGSPPSPPFSRTPSTVAAGGLLCHTAKLLKAAAIRPSICLSAPKSILSLRNREYRVIWCNNVSIIKRPVIKGPIDRLVCHLYSRLTEADFAEMVKSKRGTYHYNYTITKNLSKWHQFLNRYIGSLLVRELILKSCC